MPTCAVCDGAIGPGAGLVTCSPACRDERRRQRTREAHAARWASDPEWRARRTRATAVSLVRRLGDDAPAWAVKIAAAPLADLVDRHVRKQADSGMPLRVPLPPVPLIERFMRYVEIQPGGCWAWTGGTDPLGYGRFSADGRPRAAHRWSYEYHVGPIPEGLVIDHLCSNPPCVRPDHLDVVTQGENVRRGLSCLQNRKKA